MDTGKCSSLPMQSTWKRTYSPKGICKRSCLPEGYIWKSFSIPTQDTWKSSSLPKQDTAKDTEGDDSCPQIVSPSGNSHCDSSFSLDLPRPSSPSVFHPRRLSCFPQVPDDKRFVNFGSSRCHPPALAGFPDIYHLNDEPVRQKAQTRGAPPHTVPGPRGVSGNIYSHSLNRSCLKNFQSEFCNSFSCVCFEGPLNSSHEISTYVLVSTHSTSCLLRVVGASAYLR